MALDYNSLRTNIRLLDPLFDKDEAYVDELTTSCQRKKVHNSSNEEYLQED